MIPDRLRRVLEAVGAEITRIPGGSHYVRVPGADDEFHFGTNGTVFRRGQYPPTGPSGSAEWTVDPETTRSVADDDDPVRITNGIAWSELDHKGPGHHLVVTQHVPTFGPHRGRLRREAVLYVGKRGSPGGLQAAAPPDGSTDPETAGYVESVLRREMPIEPLVDHLADRHGVSHWVRDYPRDYDAAVDPRG